MRWHHFVLAIICENDLYDYHNLRDSAFAQFVKSADESPEAAVIRLRSELRFAPLVQKSTSHRAAEFETHLYRIDVSLKGHIPPFLPNGTRAALINWARLALYTAEKRWKAQRSITSVT